MHPNYTPYAHMSDLELVLEAANKTNPTDLEIEFMLRLEKVVADMENAKNDA